jgi:hypothetical protein
MPHRQANVVETFQQAGAAKGIDRERFVEAQIVLYGLRLQRHMQHVAGDLSSFQQESHFLIR